MVVISPHLGDAVFGCGALLADRPGSTVLTAFAGVPGDAVQRTRQDERSGFASAHDAVSARRGEDWQALERLGATPVWLEFCESRYGGTPDLATLATALAQALRPLAPDCVVAPLGLFDSDHRLLHDAWREAWRELPAVGALLAYEEAIYRAVPGLLQQRLAELGTAGWQATPAALHGADRHALKPLAVQAYASPLRALDAERRADLARPERCWRLERVPARRHGAGGP